MVLDESDAYEIMMSFKEDRVCVPTTEYEDLSFHVLYLIGTQFLRQTQYLQYEAGYCSQTTSSLFVYKIPFNFTIPRMLLSCDPTATEHFLCLPPSLQEGEPRETPDGRLYMQPFINYNIRASVRFRGTAVGPSVDMQESREILLIPFTEESPPLEVEDFPGEFWLVSTRSLKASCLANPFGEMSISMDEPPPLRISTDGGNATSMVKLQLSLRLASGVTNKIKPHTWSCTIESHILVKTFYSTVPLRSMPGNRLVQDQSRIQVKSNGIELPTRTINLLEWRHDRHSELNMPTQDRNAPWTMTLYLPATAPSSLLPTFCSALAARRYALRLRLKIKGLHHSMFVLVVPLQVIHCSQADKALEDTLPQSSPSWQDTRDTSSVSDIGDHRIYPVSCEFHAAVLLSHD
jgi:hypothetical protein